MRYPDIHTVRSRGRSYCLTEGSGHYLNPDGPQVMDLISAHGMAEDFCLGNILKYATRFKRTQDLSDLTKVVDYAHLLVGLKLYEEESLQCK